MTEVPATEALRQQRTLYGAPIGELVGRVRDRLGLTQGRVAQVLGISAPMLSQLVSGQRTKIGNPLVVDRLDQLTELAEEVDRGLEHAAVEPRLEAIRGSETTARTRRSESRDHVLDLHRVLRAVASGRELHDAADLLAPTHPALAELLRVHGDGRPDDVRRHLASLADLL